MSIAGIHKQLQKLAREDTLDEAVLLDALKVLDGKKVTLQDLKATKIGKTVNMLRQRAKGSEVRSLAKALVLRWKSLVPGEDGAGRARPARKRRQTSYNEDSMADRVVDKAQEARSAGEGASTGGKPAPGAAKVTSINEPHPKRHAKTRRLVFKGAPDFYPNLTPAQILRAGAFGGTYFRPITSRATGQQHRDAHLELPKEWLKGIHKTRLTRAWKNYAKDVNLYGVKCGGDLDIAHLVEPGAFIRWESSGWINPLDPYGWFQWYCRFYEGRRSTDDARQIARWRGVCSEKGRFRNQLIGRCARGGTSFDDTTISPVIRQSLLHWGYELTSADADEYVALKGLPALAEPAEPDGLHPADKFLCPG